MDQLVDSLSLLSDTQGLADRARAEGYLFLPGLLGANRILGVREAILAELADSGWLAPNTNPKDAVATPGMKLVEPEPAFMQVYDKLQCIESFHALAHAEPILSTLKSVVGEEVVPHARNIARVIFPHNEKFTTPAHQDYVHIQGTEDTWTAWIPLGDCPSELGGLAVLQGSHKCGVLPTESAYGAGGLGINTSELAFKWRTTDFRAGDVLLFHSLTVHMGLPNRTAKTVRLSVDYRYQGRSQPVVESSFLPHHGRLGWDDIYAGWSSTQYQYYWRNLPLLVEPWLQENRLPRPAR